VTTTGTKRLNHNSCFSSTIYSQQIDRRIKNLWIKVLNRMPQIFSPIS